METGTLPHRLAASGPGPRSPPPSSCGLLPRWLLHGRFSGAPCAHRGVSDRQQLTGSLSCPSGCPSGSTSDLSHWLRLKVC